MILLSLTFIIGGMAFREYVCRRMSAGRCLQVHACRRMSSGVCLQEDVCRSLPAGISLQKDACRNACKKSVTFSSLQKKIKFFWRKFAIIFRTKNTILNT